MGLDVEINMKVFKKGDDKPILQKDVAYWRKCYGVRDVLLRIARNPEYWRPRTKEEPENDCFTHFTVEGLKQMIQDLSTMVAYPNEYPWNNAIWAPLEVVTITLEQLRKMIPAYVLVESKFQDDDAFYTVFDYIEVPDGPTAEEDADAEWKRLYNIRENWDDYIVIFELVNSY